MDSNILQKMQETPDSFERVFILLIYIFVNSSGKPLFLEMAV